MDVQCVLMMRKQKKDDQVVKLLSERDMHKNAKGYGTRTRGSGKDVQKLQEKLEETQDPRERQQECRT